MSIRQTIAITPKNLGPTWMKAAVIFLLIAAIMGGVLRFYYAYDIPFVPFKYILHAHSHMAMLGWGYMLLSGLYIFILLPSGQMHDKRVRLLFWLNIVSVAGMFIFFLLEGYGPFSIAFCTLHLISVYIFAGYFLYRSNENTLIRWSIYWLLLSTIGLWMLGPVIAILGKQHPLYQGCIQFFLHFQFNGWFTYGIAGLLIREFSSSNEINRFTFLLLQGSLVLTFILSIQTLFGTPLMSYLNGLGSLLQIGAYVLLFRTLTVFRTFNNTTWNRLLLVGIACLACKIWMQAVVSLQVVSMSVLQIRSYVIAFIHLTMMGWFSLTALSLLFKYEVIPDTGISQWGARIFTGGFLLSEFFLFSKVRLLSTLPDYLHHYQVSLFIVTVFISIGVFGITIGMYRPSNRSG